MDDMMTKKGLGRKEKKIGKTTTHPTSISFWAALHIILGRWCSSSLNLAIIFLESWAALMCPWCNTTLPFHIPNLRHLGKLFLTGKTNPASFRMKIHHNTTRPCSWTWCLVSTTLFYAALAKLNISCWLRGNLSSYFLQDLSLGDDVLLPKMQASFGRIKSCHWGQCCSLKWR